MIQEKLRFGLAIAMLLGAFVAGRYSATQKPEVKTVSSVQDVTKEASNKDTHSVTTTKVIQQPDGAKETDTTTTVDTVAHNTDVITDTSKVTTDVIPPKTNTVNVSALAAIDNWTPYYGVSVSKQVLGPITVGGFGLTNGTLGISIGINF
jgi:hypothetical protein